MKRTSRKQPRIVAAGVASALVFAALGDETRLALLNSLSRGAGCSITELTAGSALTRQGIRKHLSVLQGAGLVRATQRGRETLFKLETARLNEARQQLDRLSREWDVALARLKSLVEE